MNNLPDEAQNQSLPIHRTPATKTLTAIITSEDLLATFTHYYRGRTTPCEKPDCEPCRNGMPYRYHAYVSAWSPRSQLHFIFECTAQAAENLVAHRDKYKTLRGCQIEAYRWGKKQNGRVVLHTTPSGVAPSDLPLPPDLVKCLSVLWNIPLPQLDPTAVRKRSPAIVVQPADPLPANGRDRP